MTISLGYLEFKSKLIYFFKVFELRSKARSIAISSGKGGTGKTTLTANLGIALANEGYDVTILDGDLSMANLSIIMGMNTCPVSFLDVISGDADPSDAVYTDYGVKVVPTGFRFEEIHESLSEVNQDVVEVAVEELLSQTEFLLIDVPAGMTDTTIISIAAAREMLPVTNPSYSSLVDTYKTIRLANVVDTWTRGLVVNRVGKNSDISRREIEHFMGKTLGSISVLSEIPDDDKVQEAEREEVPIMVYSPQSSAARSIYELAKIVTGESDLPYELYEEGEVDLTVKRLSRALVGRRS